MENNNKNKVFDRSISFSFYQEWKADADTIEEDFGAEGKAAYYDAIINYALYEIEPEMTVPIKYFWNTLKEKIDASQEHRSKSFKGDTELTQKIIDYKNANPEASQREIATACNCSVGKVNKALKDVTITSTITNTSTSTSTSVNVNTVNTVNTTEEKEEKRELEDLEERELEEIVTLIENKTRYKDIQAKFNLAAQVSLDTKKACNELICKKREKEEADKINSDEYKFISEYFDDKANKVDALCRFIGVSVNDMYNFATTHPQHSMKNYKASFPKEGKYKQYLLDVMKVGD